MAWIIRIIGIICVLGGIVLLNLDLATGGKFFLDYALAVTASHGMSMWFGLFIWLMPIYVGIMLLVSASLDESLSNRNKQGRKK